MINKITKALNIINPDLKDIKEELDFSFMGNVPQGLPEITRQLESDGVINYTIEEVQTENDQWLQVEYYSNKLHKTIIFDPASSYYYDNLQALVRQLAEYQEKINALENSITINK